MPLFDRPRMTPTAISNCLRQTVPQSPHVRLDRRYLGTAVGIGDIGVDFDAGRRQRPNLRNRLPVVGDNDEQGLNSRRVQRASRSDAVYGLRKAYFDRARIRPQLSGASSALLAQNGQLCACMLRLALANAEHQQPVLAPVRRAGWQGEIL